MSDLSELPVLDCVEPVFPDTGMALDYPNGLLAVGGNLQPDVLLAAYSKGIFPWYSEHEPILWWTPKTRAVLLPGDLRINRSNRKQLRKLPFSLTTNTCFDRVITSCAALREESGTWISDDIIAAYSRLHRAGIAQSVEVWEGADLVGGLYGIKLGAVFCGESMFNNRDSAAKFAFSNLANRLFNSGYKMIDCQIPNPFLTSLGVREIAREEFECKLADGADLTIPWPDNWSAAASQ